MPDELLKGIMELPPSLDPALRKPRRHAAAPKPITPWTLTGESEHSQQAAFFCWASFAARWGYVQASKPECWEWAAAGPLTDFQKLGRGVGVPVLTRLHAIPNGGQRDKATAGNLKAEGVKTGVPDVFLPAMSWVAGPAGRAYAGLYLEFKREMYRTRKNGGMSDEQIDWRDYLETAGYKVELVYNWIEAASAVTQYLSA